MTANRTTKVGNPIRFIYMQASTSISAGCQTRSLLLRQSSSLHYGQAPSHSFRPLPFLVFSRLGSFILTKS